jgi:acetate CoA/acetoacetate CoA-transferase alpha subunit
MIAAFMAVGTPKRVINEIARQRKRDLPAIANETATPETGIGNLG